MIYLPDDIFDMLSKEENQSELISDLLRTHFGTNASSKEELQKKLKGILENTDYRVNIIKKQIETIEDEEKKTELQKNIEKANFLDKIRNIVKNAKEVFDFDITEDQAKEYMKGGYNNLKEYVCKIRKG